MPVPAFDDLNMLKLCRELAAALHPVETILNRYQITPEQYASLQTVPRFRALLQQESEAWESARNTHERVKLKSAAAIEEWIPELYARLHDRSENLTAKVEGGKLLAKIAEMGLTNASVAGGDRLSVTINLGADRQIKIEKQAPVIEGELADD